MDDVSISIAEPFSQFKDREVEAPPETYFAILGFGRSLNLPSFSVVARSHGP